MQLAPPADEQHWLSLEGSPIATAILDPQGRLLAINDSFRSLLGYEDCASLTFEQVTHPDDVSAGLVLMQQTLAGVMSSYRAGKRCLHADGRFVWAEVSVSLVRDDEGAPLYFVSQILDVTEQRSALQQLASAEASLELQRRKSAAVYDTVDVGLVLLDADGTYQSANQRQQDFLDLAYPNGHGGRAGQTGEVYAEDGTTLLLREELPTSRAVRGEEFDDLRMWIGADPASRRAISVSARRVRDQDGGFAGAVLAYKDVTDYLNAASVKDEFVASVSHELRTPMTSILGHLEILADDPSLSPDVLNRIKTVERNALRLRRLVTDLLDVQRDSMSGLQIEPAECDVAQIVCDSVEAATPWASSAGVVLRSDVPATLVGRADPDRLRQVIDNLISNAIKYNETGGAVEVLLSSSADLFEISVADDGIGIAEEDLPRLFTRFHRGKAAREQHIPGTGLGLNIIRAIVEAHGGRIDIASRPGEGTRATATFPHRSSA